jgi:hypothetical protein
MVKPLLVSDHAVLRWLERHHGVDIEAARDEIRKVVRPLFAGLPSQSIKINGTRFIIKNGTVTTFLPPRRNPGWKINLDRGGE